MHNRNWFKFLTVVGACLITQSLGAIPAQAAPTAPYCALEVGPTSALTGVSPVLSKVCSSISQADADRQFRSNINRTHQSTAGAQSLTALIMTWYSDVGYGGNSTTIYGSSGPCDASGYTVYPDDYWRYNLSSLKGTGPIYCTRATLTDQTTGNSATVVLDCINVGSSLNDNVNRIHVYSTT